MSAGKKIRIARRQSREGWRLYLGMGGTGALGDPDSEALSSSASNWSGSALSPRMRKNPAMVAERKMRMTRSGHISDVFSKEAINE